ncbi:hypothetical protein MIND_00936300 [Mycena indigotica]|uniref:DUF6534 domain-containing protein n=1 Tax=Mycena indigotica TaxID=2126181 RepID=A0A8H6SDN3_9AGAR|nr:uncharacterized protein MIND_00936300 [Mycena indigotica]KAF7297038.1 hypothetical protein MIND_00936300 [Mycena indigotica]
MAGSGVELLFGPMLIGTILSSICYGIMSLQMFIYYQTYKKDLIWIRYFVLYLFLAETTNLLFEIGIIYEPLIVRYGAPRALVVSPILLPGDAISIVLVSTPIQMFTAWRISVITGKKIFSVLISLFALVSFGTSILPCPSAADILLSGGGAMVSIFTVMRNQYREFASFTSVIILWLVCSAFCDVLIAVVLTYSLSTRKTGFTAVDGQINRIIRLTVQTGAITAVAALLDLILFLSFPTSTVQFIPDFPLSKMYSICLVSTLNARARGKSDVEQQRLPNALFKDSTGLTSASAISGSRDGATGASSLTSPVNLYSSPIQYYPGSGSMATLVPTDRSALSSSGHLKSTSSSSNLISRPLTRPRSRSQPPSHKSSYDDLEKGHRERDLPPAPPTHSRDPSATGRQPHYIQPRPRKDSAAQAMSQAPVVLEPRRPPPRNAL